MEKLAHDAFMQGFQDQLLGLEGGEVSEATVKLATAYELDYEDEGADEVVTYDSLIQKLASDDEPGRARRMYDSAKGGAGRAAGWMGQKATAAKDWAKANPKKAIGIGAGTVAAGTGLEMLRRRAKRKRMAAQDD